MTESFRVGFDSDILDFSKPTQPMQRFLVVVAFRFQYDDVVVVACLIKQERDLHLLHAQDADISMVLQVLMC